MTAYKTEKGEVILGERRIHYSDLARILGSAQALPLDQPRLSGRLIVSSDGLGPVFGSFEEGTLLHLTVQGQRMTPEQIGEITEHAYLARNLLTAAPPKEFRLD